MKGNVFGNRSGWLNILTVLSLAILCIPSSSLAQNRLQDVIADELQREMNELKTKESPPYYISYTVTDVHNTVVSASFGSLNITRESDARILLVQVRVGDYKLDNFHELRGQSSSSSGSRYVQLVLDDNNEKALRTAIWQETNRRIKTPGRCETTLNILEQKSVRFIPLFA